jgi:glutamate-5-semialdehyde dehydrogenase
MSLEVMVDVLNVKDYMAEVGRNARVASRVIAAAPTALKNKALLAIADALNNACGGKSERSACR